MGLGKGGVDQIHVSGPSAAPPTLPQEVQALTRGTTRLLKMPHP